MEKTPEISIIVPVYNSAETIKECVNSIVAQDFTNWELLLVDDGSSDCSHGICLKLAAQDKRMVALQQEHKGVSAARNLALDKARGTYICFVDADDTVEPDYLSSLYERHDYDMVICGYYVDCYNEEKHLVNREIHSPAPLATDINDNKETLVPLFKNGMINSNWNKIYKREIIINNKIKFRNYSINEDNIFNILYMKYVQSIITIEKPLYHWIRIENKKTGVSSIPENLLDIYNEAHRLTRDFFGNDIFADKILYYSYNFIVLKYFNAIKENIIPCKTAFAKLRDFHRNNLVKAAYNAYTPKSKGDWIVHEIQKRGYFKLYYLLRQTILK